MKSFNQYITEKRDIIMVLSPYGSHYGDEDALRITGLVNPSRGELEGFIRRSKQGGARFILNKDRLLVWDAMEAIHSDVLEGEYRLGKSALHKMSKTRDFAYGMFHMDSGKLAVSLVEPEKWVTALLRKNSRTNHIVTKDVEIVITDENGIPIGGKR